MNTASSHPAFQSIGIITIIIFSICPVFRSSATSILLLLVFPPATPRSNNPVNLLSNHVANNTEHRQSRRNTEEPSQISLDILSRDPDVHTPHSGDDVHRQDNRSQDREFAQHVSVLLRALVHADVDLRHVVAVSAGEESVNTVVS